MVSPLVEQILQAVQDLPEEDQRQVLNFAEFLRAKYQKPVSTENDTASESFLDTARDAIGMGEGPGDLSTNPTYMQGYGQ